MEHLFGVILALFVPMFATLVGLDRDRALYPTVLAVIASYYGLFALTGGSVQALVAEFPTMIFFLAATVFGFRRNLWLVVAGLIAHGVFDFVHGYVTFNPGVPAWWPMFCLVLDAAAAAHLAWLQQRSWVRLSAGHAHSSR